jgi:hypothetical protein
MWCWLKTGSGTDLPASSRRIFIAEYVVTQCDSCNCTGKIPGARRGIEAVFARALF